MDRATVIANGRQLIRRGYYDTWIPEYLATCLSLANMTIIVILLAFYNERSTSDWALPASVSPNAIIATLNTLSRLFSGIALSSALGQWKWIKITGTQQRLKDFVLIDQARQGFGSIKTLWKTRGQMISIGAVLVILSFASEPFIQQILRFESLPVYQDGPQSSIIRAFAYNPETLSPKASMRGSLEQALAAEQVTDLSNPPSTCPSGNCTYPHFESLGICSSCTDLTSHLNLTMFNSTPIVALPDYTFYFDYLDGYSAVTFHSDYYTVMNSTATGRNASWWWNLGGSGMQILNAPNHYTQATNISSPDFIFAMSIINMTNMDRLGSTPVVGDFSATECSLSICVQQIETYILDGKMHQNRTKRTDIDIDASGLYGLDIVDPDQGGYIILKSPNGHANYTVSGFGLEMMSDFLTQDFLGLLVDTQPNYNDTFGDDSDGVLSKIQFDFPTVRLDKDYQPGAVANPAMQAIYSTGNFSQTFELLAYAMTNEMLRGDNTTKVTGSMGTLDTILIVRWAWISLPLGVVIGSAIFLLLTVGATARAKAPIWKADLLPVLFHGLHLGAVQEEIANGLEERTAMRSYANDIDVRLVHTAMNGTNMSMMQHRTTLRRQDDKAYAAVGGEDPDSGQTQRGTISVPPKS